MRKKSAMAAMSSGSAIRRSGARSTACFDVVRLMVTDHIGAGYARRDHVYPDMFRGPHCTASCLAR